MYGHFSNKIGSSTETSKTILLHICYVHPTSSHTEAIRSRERCSAEGRKEGIHTLWHIIECRVYSVTQKGQTWVFFSFSFFVLDAQGLETRFCMTKTITSCRREKSFPLRNFTF
jgi:hypothetical protein